jgi:predicted NUDIX family phosphoesterase
MAGPFVEHVLCVRRDEVFPEAASNGFLADGLDRIQRVLREGSFFMPRSEVEEDPSYQQVIPYVVFRHDNRYLLTRRLKASSEKRLRQLYSLGVGGHINPGDLENGDPIADGLKREWEEEVVYDGHFSTRLLGAINDQTTPVGRVHVGLIFLVEGDRPEISIREVDKLAGALFSLDEMRSYYLDMESWSQLIFDYLTRVPVA